MGKRLAALTFALVLVALLVNAAVTDRVARAAESFGGGHVLDLPGADLNVREYGSGGDRAVVLLHGYTASIQWWEAVAPALAAGNRVIAIDLIGHGGSESPRDAAAYSAEAQAAAVHQALGALGVRHAVVIGHSMGGMVATALAENVPEMVDRVVVSDTPGDDGLVAMPALGDAVCWPVLGASLDRLRSIDTIDKTSLQTGFAADYPVPDFAYRSLKGMTHNALCGPRKAPNFNAQRAVADRLAGLGKPVLVLWGERDVLTPTQPNVDRYRETGLQPVVIAGSGHTPMVERPTEFLGAVEGFVHGTAKR